MRWQEIPKDFRGCYYQMCKLLDFVAKELLHVLLFEFVSQFPTINLSEDDAEFVCHFGFELKQLYLSLTEVEDKW